MNLKNKQTAFQNYKTLFIIVIVILIAATILFSTGKYPFKLENAEFFISIVSTLLLFGIIYLILRYAYKK